MTFAEYKELIEWACAMVGATVIIVRVVWVLSRLLEPNVNSNAPAPLVAERSADAHAQSATESAVTGASELSERERIEWHKTRPG